MTGVLDLVHLMAHSKMGALAYAVDAEAGERDNQLVERDLLTLFILEHVTTLIPLVAQARGVRLVLDRQRAGVLWVDPAVDLTAAVLGLFDAWFDKAVEVRGLPSVKAGIQARLEALRRQSGERQQIPTGQYL